MVRPTIILTREEIKTQIDIAQVIPAIEEAMGAFEKGGDYLPPKAIFELPNSGEGGTSLAACITGYTKATELLSMKIGQERSDNPERNLPTTNSWINAFDPDTGELLMISDGTIPTMLRTAAAAAVGADKLARQDSQTLAVIGAGQLGRQCIRAATAVRKFERVLIADVFPEACKAAIEELSGQVDTPMEAASAEEACRAADVIVTATNSRKPIIMSDWIREGTHLSTMGSDLHAKIECEMELLPRCRKFADMIEHVQQRGEVSQAIEAGILEKDCFIGTLGQVINGDIVGRESDEQITMYDGVGIGIQDTTVARAILDQAVEHKLGTQIQFS